MFKFFYGCVVFVLLSKVSGGQELKGLPVSEEKNVFCNTQNDLNWIQFSKKIRSLQSDHEGQIIIVHLGDSHIQGGYFTNRLRDLLTQRYGEAGRGFVFPYSLAKTNGPDDLSFVSSAAWIAQKYNHSSAKTGIEGYNLICSDTFAKISLSLNQGKYPFNELVIYHSKSDANILCTSESSIEKIDSDLFATHFLFREPVYDSSFSLKISGCFTIQGLDLRNDHPGIRYHAIGVNGLTYDSYLNHLNYLPMLKALHPDCIVISLGTNDAYVKHVSESLFKANVITMVTSIRKALPHCCILLTTPGDHLFAGKNINPNLVKIQSAIIQVAQEQNCVYWDFFSAMGGLGSSQSWAKTGGMYKDNVHLSKNGYKWQGEMFYEAFYKAVEQGN